MRPSGPIKFAPRARELSRAPQAFGVVRGFTLVELILVMAIMATVMAVAAPMLSRSLRERHLGQEALGLMAMTEAARQAAITDGVPMLFWNDAASVSYGMEPKAGFTAEASATRSFELPEDIWVDSVGQAMGTSTTETTVEFAPDGVPEI